MLLAQSVEHCYATIDRTDKDIQAGVPLVGWGLGSI